MKKNKKEKRPWLKTKKKTGPKKNKKKVFDEDGEKLFPKPHIKRIAHKPRYNNRYIEFFGALSFATYCAQRWSPGCE